MSLDIYLGATEEDASRVSRVAEFDEVLHRQIFERGLLRENECRLFRRMSSYCDDAIYNYEECEYLAFEAESLLDRVNPVLAVQLQQIAMAARQASQKGLNLYVFCD